MLANRLGEGRLAERVDRLRRSGALGRGLWGISYQALVSLTNFVMMVLLARSLSPGGRC